mmetsp:Transcript_119061/g.332211  ORF Transcript_119061/g.332211 Transcript_119061/m.332211 type:complete len:216 (-) Transcript_119061:74-721(-)
MPWRQRLHRPEDLLELGEHQPLPGVPLVCCQGLHPIIGEALHSGLNLVQLGAEATQHLPRHLLAPLLQAPRLLHRTAKLRREASLPVTESGHRTAVPMFLQPHITLGLPAAARQGARASPLDGRPVVRCHCVRGAGMRLGHLRKAAVQALQQRAACLLELCRCGRKPAQHGALQDAGGKLFARSRDRHLELSNGVEQGAAHWGASGILLGVSGVL